MTRRTPVAAATQKLLSRAGKTYEIDAALPDGLLLRELAARTAQLLRGLVRFRSVVFVERGVWVRGKGHLRLGRGAALGRHTRVDAYGRGGVNLGARSKLGAYTLVTTTSHLSRYGEGLSVGEDTGIGEFAHLGCSGGVTFGRDVIVGPFLTVHSQEHVAEDPAIPIRRQGTTEHEVLVEDDVWIGARVTILAGSRVGRGSIIAAGSVVKGEFPPYSLIAGVPARKVRAIRGHD